MHPPRPVQENSPTRRHDCSPVQHVLEGGDAGTVGMGAVGR